MMGLKLPFVNSLLLERLLFVPHLVRIENALLHWSVSSPVARFPKKSLENIVPIPSIGLFDH